MSVPPNGPTRHLDFLIGLALILIVLLQGFHTVHRVGISWDEPFYFQKAVQYVEWAVGLPGGLSASRREEVFGQTLKKDDHPTGSKILGAIGIIIFPARPHAFWSFRMAGPCLFSLTLAAIYWWLRKTWNRRAALAAAVAAGLMPGLFVQSHIMATDFPLAVFWLLSVMAFDAACRDRRFIPLSVAVVGFALSIKFTAWFIFAPLFISGIIYRRRTFALPFMAILMGAPLVFLLLQPAMWDHPARDFYQFVSLNLSHAKWAPHWVYFLGRDYNAAPWYYAPVVTLATTPALSMVMAIAAIVAIVRNRFRDPTGGMSFINFLFPLLLTMAPGAPKYDGARLFLPAFFFLAVLAGRGFDLAASRLEAVIPGKKKLASLAAGAAFLALSALPLARVYPYGLEYYSEMVGGLAGARKLGLETTYWWTVASDQALRRISAIASGRKLRFFPMDDDLWQLYQETGLLGSDVKITNGQDFDLVCVLSRPYASYPRIFRTIGVPVRYLHPVWGIDKDGVQLLMVYEKRAAITP